MPNEYFIEKHRLPVEVELVSGERVGGDLFIQASWRGPSVLEDAPEFMNAPESFFPIQLADQTTRLVAKRHVMVLKSPSSVVPVGDGLFGEPAHVTVELRNGSIVSGTIMIEALSPHARVLDYLNRATEEFVTLHDPTGDLLVNRRHIVSVTELVDGAD